MSDDWQNLAEEDVTPPAPKPVVPADANKWAGEDEDDEIKDSWDADDDDEKKDNEKKVVSAAPKQKKTLNKIIAEKEAKQAALEEKRRKEKEEEDMAHMTPEERVVEKLRLKKLQEEADLKIGLDSMGLSPTSSSALDSFNPTTKEEFAEFSDAISKTITQFKSKEEYVTFLDTLVVNLCAGLSSTNIRKIKTSLDNLHLEKQKIEKGDKPKKKAGPKTKVKLRIEGDDDYNSRATAFEADDYDDFM